VSWQDRAACAGTTMLLFFGPDGETQADQEARESEARAVCASCPVRAECLAHALRHSVRYGLWGGLNERERSLERRRRARSASAA
jgi:WhiB family transcriptional regulator, redox-sensing transcriptional regulator